MSKIELLEDSELLELYRAWVKDNHYQPVESCMSSHQRDLMGLFYYNIYKLENEILRRMRNV
jgi:hypothetical protein